MSRPDWQRGAATVEFYIVSLFALLPLCLGALQIALLLIANHHVDYAAFSAARAGAVFGGRQDEMRQAFADALLPLLVTSEGGIDRENVVSRVTEARLRARSELVLYGEVQLLWPDRQVQQDFATLREGHNVIPNHSLRALGGRRGSGSGRTLREANVLVIAATWCHPMIVPFARELLMATMRRFDRDPRHQLCLAEGRMPIRSRGVAPMQSDFLVRN